MEEKYIEKRITSTINVRVEPNIDSATAGIPYKAGEIVMVFEEKDGWGRVGENEWINLQYTEDII